MKEIFQKGDDDGFDGEGHQDVRCNSGNEDSDDDDDEDEECHPPGDAESRG